MKKPDPSGAAGAASEPIVLGVDPGTRAVGWGAVRVRARGFEYLGAGVLLPRRSASVAVRLADVRAGLDRVLAEIRPDVVVVERAFASRNVQSALRIGEGRGVVLAGAATFGCALVEIAPAAAKKALVGHGGASKPQVARMVAATLGLAAAPASLDASDALALALAHLLRARSPIAARATRRAFDALPERVLAALAPADRARLRSPRPGLPALPALLAARPRPRA